MNKNKYQSGNVHFIIIIVLVVALLGALGLIFWQNFIQPKPGTSKTDSVKTPSTTTSSLKGYLVLDNWGVKFKLPSDLGNNEITYSIRTFLKNNDTYYFSTQQVEALGESCIISAGQQGHIGRVSRSVTPMGWETYIGDKISHIDGYYYYYASPQSTCSDNGVEIQHRDRAMIHDTIITIEKK